MNFTHITHNRKSIYLAFLIPIIFRLIMGTQGVDSTDVGFCNTFYQAIFNAPDTNEFNFIYYLTGLLGGSWELLFGNFGLIGFRIFETLTLSAAVYFLYLIYKERMSKGNSVAAIFLSMLFPVIIVTFHYDTLSYLLIAISAFMYSKYLQNFSYKWLFFAGLMIGFSFFARIVNLSFSILALLPLLVTIHTKQQRLKACGSMLCGIGGGILIIAIIMLSCGHFDNYMAGLNDAFSTLDRSDATHSKGEMIIRYLKSLKNVLLQILILTSITFCLFKNDKQKYKCKIYIKYLLYVIIFIMALTSTVYLTTLSCALIIILSESYKQRHIQGTELHITLFLLIATLCFPMGSDIGLQGIFNWCAGLLIFPAVYYSKYIKKAIFSESCKAAYISCAICAICKISYKAYNESEPRIHCFTTIQPSRLNTMTDKTKAKKYQKAITAIKEYSIEEQHLLLTTQASELYYATKKMPYLGHVQTIIYQGKRLELRLEERLAHFGTLPLIATLNIQKEPHELANEKILRTWMNKHHYKQVYKDNYITLYNNESKSGY